MRRLLPVLLILALLIVGPGGSAGSAQYKGFPIVNVNVNGRLLVSDVPPITIDGRTLIPLRAVADALGAAVSWNAETQTVHVDSNELPKRMELIALNHLSNQLVWLSNLDRMMGDMNLTIEDWQNGVLSTQDFEQVWSRRMGYILRDRKQLVGMSTYFEASASLKSRLHALGALTPTQIDLTLDKFVENLTEGKRLAMSGQRDQALIRMSNSIENWRVLGESIDNYQVESYLRMNELLQG